MIRLRSLHLRAFARQGTADKSRSGGQVAASAGRVLHSFQVAGSANQARRCVATALFMAIASGARVFACPLCFGAEETSMIDGAKLGVLVMLAVTLAVQGGFVCFFFYLRKRAKRIADIELDTEWSKLQRSPRTS